MKKLLALSIALLSLNLYGAAYSHTGLEGWGKKGSGLSPDIEGVAILIEMGKPNAKEDKTYDINAIKNQVELKLKLADIKVTTKGVNTNLLYINITEFRTNERLVGYAIDIRPQRVVMYKVNDKFYRRVVAMNNYGGVSSTKYKDLIDDLMNKLLLDYLKANPKK